MPYLKRKLWILDRHEQKPNNTWLTYTIRPLLLKYCFAVT